MTQPTQKDLEWFNDDFEQAEVVESGDFENVPDGMYQVFVNRVTLEKTGGKSKNPGMPILKWDLQVFSGQHKDRHIFRNNIIATAENARWLKTDLHRCGMSVDGMRLSNLPERLGELLDVQLEVQVKSKDGYTNVYINRKINVEFEPKPKNDSGQQPDTKHNQDGLPF